MTGHLTFGSSPKSGKAAIAEAERPGNTPVAAPTGTGRDLPNLDLMRAVAVLSVVISHGIAAAGLPIPLHRYGAFGVGLFFIHTSLVLMWSLERRPSVADFYTRRVFRIYPLAVLAVAATVLTHAPVSVGQGAGYFIYLHLTGRQILEHLLLVQNLFSGNALLYVLWSLPLEVDMYLLLPALFFFVRATRSPWPILAFWVLAWLFCAREFNGLDLNLAYATCFFLPGVLSYALSLRYRPVLPAALFPVLLAAVFIAGGLSTDWRWAAPPALLLGLTLPFFRQLTPAWIAKPSWLLARYSYGIYLLHPFALVFGFKWLPAFPLAAQAAVAMLSTAVLSVLAFHLVERPMIRLGGRIAARAATT